MPELSRTFTSTGFGLAGAARRRRQARRCSGIRIRSSPRASVVYSSPSELTTPSTVPPTRTGLKPHALADAERSRGEQHQAGEQVAERLLGGETQDDGGEGAPRDERGGVDAADAQRDQQRDRHRYEADQEPDGSGRGRIHPPEERRRRRATDVAGDRPAERQQREHRRDADRRLPRLFGPIPKSCCRYA